MLQPLWKTVWWFFKKLEIALPNDPAILFLGYPQRIKSNLQEILCTHVLSSVIDNSEKVEGAQVSMNGHVGTWISGGVEEWVGGWREG